MKKNTNMYSDLMSRSQWNDGSWIVNCPKLAELRTI